MDLVDKLRIESSSEHVAYTEFLLKYKNRKDCLFCFFEGKNDFKYYGIRIQNIYNNEFDHISCGGKENVLGLKKLLENKKEYTDVKKAYFIDKDFEPKIEITNVYCLPSYSIENQYCTENVLMRILKNEFSVDEADPDFQRIINLFQSLRSEFHSETLTINSWLACQSDKRKILENKTFLNVDSTIGKYFKSIINPDLKSIKTLHELNDLSKIQEIFSDAPIITKEELEAKKNELSGLNPVNDFRGKFELQFFISFLDRLKNEICKRDSSIFESKHKCSLRFEFSTSLTNLSIYAETPNCLIDYLNAKRKNAA